MKFRTDFVTNSSSANFIITLTLASDNANASVNVAVSPETALTIDGDLTGDYIGLAPTQKDDDILFNGKSIYKAKDINELCDWMFDAAIIEGWQEDEEWDGEEECEDKTFVIDGKLKWYETKAELTEFIREIGGKVSNKITKNTDYVICNNPDTEKCKEAKEKGIQILTEFDFMKLYDEDSFYDYRCDNPSEVSVSEAVPTAVQRLKDECAKAGISMDNLKTIIVENNKEGRGDSAMFVEYDAFKEFRERYKAANEEEKEKILQELVAFVKSNPVIDVCDNEFVLPEQMKCIFTYDSDKSLYEAMKGCMEEERGYWMAEYSESYEINVKEKTMEKDEVLYV